MVARHKKGREMSDQLKEEMQSRALAALASMIEDVYRYDYGPEAKASLSERMDQVVDEFKRAVALVSAIG